MRASGSVGANYIEANEAVSKKEFILRPSSIIEENPRKVVTGFAYWIQAKKTLEAERSELVQESTELMKIFVPSAQLQ